MHRQFHYNAGGGGVQAQTTANPKKSAIMLENESAALAAVMFDHFSSATTMRQILGLHRNICDEIGVRPGPLNEFYPKLKAKIKNWKAQALWKKFDARLSHRVYNKGTACNGTRVLIIGAGPCGLRTAIEAQLLGAKVVVIEKRDRMSRNNVLHLWPFLITDLKSLGAKKFYGKFCAGSIDHISIRQLQCVLMKTALLLGVEIQEGISFERVLEPSDGCGWRALVEPRDHAVSHFEFDALIGADGKRNTLEGFKRKEFRGKLAIAITANFINKKTEEEARVQEISGVAFIFNQAFFKELYHQTGIDLENIVYYKDECHYFVMTAKKHSLLDKGVIIQDFSDPAELLSPHNVNMVKLQDYAREAADFSTKYQMPNLEFAVNHYGKPDVAMFDFTSMFAADNSSRITVRKNYRLLSCLVGDSLLEPFWPSGSGCARGFLSGMDAAYAIKLFSNSNNSALAVLAQRESIYRLLAQTTPENLHRDMGGYTLDPVTRYPNLNRQSVIAHQVKHLLDTDDPSLLEQTFMDTNAISSIPEPRELKRKRRTVDTTPMAAVLLGWIKSHLKDQDFVASIQEPSQCFTHGKVLCALIHRYRPDLVDWPSIQECSAEESNEIAFNIFENEFNIAPVMTAKESILLENTEIKVWHHYLEQICEVFRGEIPHVKHPKMDFAEYQQQKKQNTTSMADFARLHRIAAAKRAEDAKNHEGGTIAPLGVAGGRSKKSNENHPTALSPQNASNEPTRRGKKRRSYEKHGNIEERLQRLSEIDANRVDRQSRRREQRKLQTENFFKSLHMLQANNYLRETDENGAFEDYSIFMYRQSAPEFNDRVKELERKLLYPDRERGIPSAIPTRGGLDDQFSDRIKDIEDKFTVKNASVSNKKPKDLLRAIGRIDSSDWQVKEINRKMELSKKTNDIGKSREKVPKWSREQFVARQTKMAKPERQDSSDLKYKEIDHTLKEFTKQLKEGSILERGERGRNKVASIAGTFGKKKDDENAQMTAKAGLILTSQGVSEACHFCKQRVYLMEKISAEGLVLHRSCLKCHHCHTNLRLGGYAFDRDSPDGKFYCTQHFKLPPKDIKFVPKRLLHKQRHQEMVAQKLLQQQLVASTSVPSDKNIRNVDLLDHRGKTPERIEYELGDGTLQNEPMAEKIMDENDWTDLNFGSGSESEDDESSSDESESESDSEMFEDPIGVDAQTLQIASEWIDKRSTIQDSEDEFYGYSSEDDDADSQTEGEELAKAREMRMNEVKLQPPLYVFTDTETEAQTDSESSEALNSATEISTDSEFDQDPINHEPPKIFIDDSHLRKTTRVHVKQGHIENGKPGPQHGSFSSFKKQQQQEVHLKFKPLVTVDPTIVLSTNRVPLKNPLPGDYMLSKTASTGGIASKNSMDLKKRYLLGETGMGSSVLKSDSASALDTKLKSFHTNISECQKLLNPAAEISPSMQTFLQRIDRNNELNRSQHNIVMSKVNKDKYNNNNPDEKENRSIDSNKKVEYSETLNTALIESKIKDISDQSPESPEIIETINLITPEKKPFIDSTRVDITKSTIADNKTFIENIERSVPENNNSTHNESNMKMKSKLDSMFIDLTVDSPIKDRDTKNSLEKNNNAVVPDIISSLTSKKEELVKEDDASQHENGERPRSPAHETTIQVPQMWNKTIKSDDEDVDTDSLSNTSSTSSLEDIPHFILDSTTSPETQNDILRFQTTPGVQQLPPRLEVRDTAGELMQIDSLMIIDGNYIGDPEDLKLFEKLPELVIEKKTNGCEPKTPKETTEDKIVEPPPTPTYSSLRPTLKFDTKNENKLESLINLPLIVPQVERPPKSLHLRFSDKISPLNSPDNDKTPLAGAPGGSDSETEMTGPGLTETELSDWTADDAVSENFIDIEFALNSGKGTMKRSKKPKRKSNGSSKSSVAPNNLPQQLTKTIEKENEHGILKNLAIEEIDFMDTGSEDSCIETYSTTNRAMLKNRGYVEFVDHNHHYNRTTNIYQNYNVPLTPKSKEKSPPILEAVNKEVAGIDFIEQGACILNNDHDQKTPMNEEPSSVFNFNRKVDHNQQLDSLNTTDVEDDSLVIVTTTTEEMLTIVTSPESLPKLNNESTTPTNSTPSNVIISGPSSDPKPLLQRDNSKDSGRFERNVEKTSSTKSTREQIEEMGGYEEYVKSLQMKIAQISSGRESLEKKARRKLSKSDLLGTNENGENSEKTELKVLQKIDDVPTIEPPLTLNQKLEGLSKERVKQKDIIHDLVMDKLQSKKLLNAEKRLNRSRNRSLFIGTNNVSASPPPRPTALQEEQNSSAGKSLVNFREKSLDHLKDDNERRHSIHLPTIINGGSPTKIPSPKEVKESAGRGFKLNKTQSFCVSKSKEVPLKDDYEFMTPIPPPRIGRVLSEEGPADKMREDARARARLKSNEDLGLSPEEKILMLRKRYNLVSSYEPTGNIFHGKRNQSDDMKYREKKLSVSKSFNDISRMHKFLKDSSDNLTANEFRKISDFVSDPNLVEVIAKEQEEKEKESPKLITKSQRRDSERRKSLIQTVSGFFHKKKDQNSSNKDLTASPTATSSKDKTTENSGMFSRFRLSPKSKETKDKAKDKEPIPPYHSSTNERSKSVQSLSVKTVSSPIVDNSKELMPPPIPPLPVNYQRSDDEGSYATNDNKNELKKLRALSKASKQAELKRLRIAQEIKREQDEIEVAIKDFELRGVEIEKDLRGEDQDMELLNESSLSHIGSSDEELLKELLEIWRNITSLKKRDEELHIRQQELQLEHRHAQLKEELSVRLSCSKLDKSSQDVAAEGAILSEMLEIVAKRAALRPSECQGSSDSPTTSSPPISLPMLPPQTTHNPLHFTANKIYQSTTAAVAPRSHRTKPQLSAKEQDI